MNNQDTYKKEALAFGYYLLGESINEVSIDRYAFAMDQLDYQAKEREQLVVERAVSKPSLIPYYDAAMALRHRDALLRKKIFVMLAILETRSEYAQYYLSKEYPKTYLFNVIAIGIRSVYRALIGLVIYRK